MQDNPSYRVFTDISSPNRFQNNNYPMPLGNSMDINNFQYKIAQAKNEFDHLIDLKIAQNNVELYDQTNEKIQNMINNIKLTKERIEELDTQNEQMRNELLEKNQGNEGIEGITSSNKESKKNLEYTEKNDIKSRIENILEDRDKIRIYKEHIDVDSYLYLSICLSFTTIPLYIGYFHVIFCKPNIPFKKRMQYLLSVCLSPIMLIPGIATPVLQLFCLYYVFQEAVETYTDMDKKTNQALKILILLIFIFMVARETTQAVNSFFYSFFEAKSKSLFFFAGCFLPPIIQASMAFLILFVSFLLIASTDDAINLIQNFASVYILLEIDNIMMNFLRLSKLIIFIVMIDNNLNILKEELGVISIFTHNILKKILVENELEIDYENNKHPYYKLAFLIVRIFTIISLVGFSAYVWVNNVVEGKTVKDYNPL